MTCLVAFLASVGVIAIGASGLALIDRWFPEGTPPALTGSTPRRPQRGPRAGKDGMHRPAAGQRRSLGCLMAWSGSVWRSR